MVNMSSILYLEGIVSNWMFKKMVIDILKGVTAG